MASKEVRQSVSRPSTIAGLHSTLSMARSMHVSRQRPGWLIRKFLA